MLTMSSIIKSFLSINALFNIIFFPSVYNGLDTNCTVQTNCLHNMYVKITVHLLTDSVICFKVSTSDSMLRAHSSRGSHLVVVASVVVISVTQLHLKSEYTNGPDSKHFFFVW